MKTFKTATSSRRKAYPWYVFSKTTFLFILVFLLNISFAQAQECTAEFELQDSCGQVKITNASSSLVGPIDYYSWDFGDGNTSTAAHPIHQYASSGSYNICLAIGSNGCVDTICMEIEVALCPNPTCGTIDILCKDEIDVLFIMDNSGSVSTGEFLQMVTIAQNTINDIDANYPNSLFGVAHYSGAYGNEVIIEHDFSNAISASNIIKPTTFGGGGDDLNEAFVGIADALNSNTNPNVTGTLSKRAGSNLFIIVFTDAFPGSAPIGYSGSAMKPYTASNLLKSTPLNGNITVVHFIPTMSLGAASRVGAAIASQGGTYTGIVDPNPGDPTPGPRQFIPADFTLSKIDILPEFPPCDSVQSTFPCEKLAVAKSSTGVECCYDIDFTNNIGTEISCVEAKVITPGWQFNIGTVATGFSWCNTPTTTYLCVENAGGIPMGTTPMALTHCFMEDPINPPVSNAYQVEYLWYCGTGEEKKLVCRDTLNFECTPNIEDPCLDVDIISVTCDPDNPYEYFVNFKVTNNSAFAATNIVLQNIDPSFRFKNCSSTTAGGGFTFMNVPLSPNPLPSTNTSGVLCVKIISNHVVLTTESLCFQAGLTSPTDCCHSPNEICIEVESCCSPCGEIEVVAKTLPADEAACCWTLDVVDSCGYQYFTKIETEILTSGVIFGYHALGGTEASNWWVSKSAPTAITWAPNIGHIPYGTTSDIIQFCLDNIDSMSQVPQKILIKYYTLGSNGLDSVACVDTLTTNCQPPVNNSCLEITQQELTCDVDNQCYQYSFWVKNTSSIAFHAEWLDVTIHQPAGMSFSGAGGTFQLSPSLAKGDSMFITTCIQSMPFPSTASDIILSYRLRYSFGDTCCYESTYDTLSIPPCTCCETNTITVTDDGACCYSLDVDVACDTIDFTKVELEILTPGVIFGAHFTGGTNPSDWTNPVSKPQQIQWAHNSGKIPTGSYANLINICFDNIFYASQKPQQVLIKWITTDIAGQDSIACEKILTFDCDPPVDNKCLYVQDSQLSCNANGTYKLDYTVCNVSNPMNPADFLVIFPLSPASVNITPTTIPVTLPAGNCYTDSLTITNVNAGDTVRFIMRLMDSQSSTGWCCNEGDTVEVVIIDCNCCTDSIQFDLDVTKGFSANTGINDTIILQPIVNFSDCYTITWDFGDGNTATSIGGQSVKHLYALPGKYNVCMLVSGPGCNAKEVCKEVDTKDPSEKCDPSKAFNNTGLTPNGDGFNDVFDLQNILNCKNIKLQVFNRWGNKVYEQPNYELGPQWDGTGRRSTQLPQGTYYYMIEFQDEGVTKTGTLDIRR